MANFGSIITQPNETHTQTQINFLIKISPLLSPIDCFYVRPFSFTHGGDLRVGI